MSKLLGIVVVVLCCLIVLPLSVRAENLFGPAMSVRSGESVSCYVLNVGPPQNITVALVEANGSPPNTGNIIDDEVHNPLGSFVAAGTGAAMTFQRIVYCAFMVANAANVRTSMIVRETGGAEP